MLFPPLVVSRVLLLRVFFLAMVSLVTSPLDPLYIKAYSLLVNIIAGKGLYQICKDDYPDLCHQYGINSIMELLSGIDDDLASQRNHLDFATPNNIIYDRVRAHCLFYYQFTNFICKPDDINFVDNL